MKPDIGVYIHIHISLRAAVEKEVTPVCSSGSHISSGVQKCRREACLIFVHSSPQRRPLSYSLICILYIIQNMRFRYSDTDMRLHHQIEFYTSLSLFCARARTHKNTCAFLFVSVWQRDKIRKKDSLINRSLDYINSLTDERIKSLTGGSPTGLWHARCGEKTDLVCLGT